jgi:hypothetical protein
MTFWLGLILVNRTKLPAAVLLTGLFCANLAVVPSIAQAEKMDIKTHTLVIKKLEKVLKDSPKKVEHNVSLILRLADLYSERARLKAIKEGDDDCKDACLGSDKDRRKAIDSYRRLLPHVDGEIGATIIMQSAHLHQILGEVDQAKRLYQGVLKEKSKRSSQIVGQAYAGLAGIQFMQSDFHRALKNYDSALKQRDSEKKGFLLYRKAWCLLNVGKTTAAINSLRGLLSNSSLLDVTNGENFKTNKSFREDVSRDYASFLARKNLTQADIDSLAELSPKSVFEQNLFYLGTEAERVGQHNAALMVWDRYLENKEIPYIQRLEIQTRTAKILFDLNRKKQAQTAYKVALSMWKKNGCSDEVECQGIYQKLRNFPISWNKLEKKKPSHLVHSSYMAFMDTFPKDYEMMNWAAQISRKKKWFLQASKDYHSAGVIAKPYRKSKDKTVVKKASRIYDGALLAEIEMAEISGKGVAKRSAYNYFLAEKPKGKKSDEIRYQLATLDYEERKYQRAALQYRALSKSALLDKKVKIQAADLALDSLAILKDHQRIETWGLDYAKTIPSKKKTYLQIARKASINLVALGLNKKPSASELRTMQKKLSSFTVAVLHKDEKLAYWKNRLLIAEKLKDIKEIKIASTGLLSLKNVSQKEQNWAKSLKVFADEMLFEFRTAYDLAKKTSFPKLSKQQTLLKLAVLADLAGRSGEANQYYREFIKKTRSYRQANTVRAQLIAKSKAPWKLIDDEIYKLAKTPDILAKVALESFGRYTNYTNAEKVLKFRAIFKYPEGKTLRRFVFLKDYWQFDKRIRAHRISQRSNSRLQNDLKKRIALLAESESWASQATKTADWTLQLITLSRLQKEKQRFYNQLMGLRPPRGLNRAQRAEYKALLAQQAKPYQDSAIAIGQKVGEFWRNSSALDSLQKDYQKANHAVRSLVRDELVALRVRAPGSVKSKINQILENRPRDPRLAEIKQAYNKVKSQPFALSPLNKLIDLEERRDQNPTMVAYLEQRKSSLKEVK